MSAISLPARVPQCASLLRRLSSQEILLALAIVILALVVGAINPRFLLARNLSDIFLGNAYVAVAVVAYLRIPAIVVTLGMLSILKGGLISVTGGKWITDLPDSFHLADIELFEILPMPVLIMIGATALAAWWMRYSELGRAIYANGGNPEAARLCGVSPRRTIVMVFALHGFFAGIAALLFATQLKVIQSTVPPNLELTIITAAVVGGVSILGGVGTVVGSTFVAILIVEIASGLVFVSISPYWIRAVQGGLILLTVVADILRPRRRLAGDS